MYCGQRTYGPGRLTSRVLVDRVDLVTRAIRYPQFLPSAFHPLPELKVQNADVVLLLVYKGEALYMTQVNDPLFAAHQPRDLLDVQNAINRTFYTSDTLLSVLGCTEQVCPRINPTPN